MQKAFPTSYWIACVGCFWFFAGFNTVLPEMPEYIAQNFNPKLKALYIPLFAFMAMLSRPFSGKISDQMGRKIVLLFGVIVSILSGFLYIFASSVVLFVLVRLFHGLSAGYTPSAIVAFIDDVVPSKRRAEGMGYLGIAISLGFAFGQSMSTPIFQQWGMNGVFLACSVFSIISVLFFMRLKDVKEYNQTPLAFKKSIQLNWSDIFEKRVIKPSIAILLLTFSGGVILTVCPDYSVFLKIENKGFYYIFFVISSIIARLFFGKFSDSKGRVAVLRIGAIISVIGLLMLLFSFNKISFFSAILIFGFGQGLSSPVLFAWATDLATDGQKGKAISTLFIFLEIGIILGGLTGGWLSASNANPYFLIFSICVAVNMVAVAFLYGLKKKSN